MESARAMWSERGIAILFCGVCLGLLLASVLAGAPRPGCYYNDGVRDTMKSAIDAGVAEIHEYEVEHARGRTSKRQEYRWKKCPDSTQNGVAK